MPAADKDDFMTTQQTILVATRPPRTLQNTLGSLFGWGLVDILSSDYMPASLLQAPFVMAQRLGTPLHQALATVTANPAKALGLTDRGELVPGKRADLLRVRMVDDVPVVVAVWREGLKVM